MRSRWRDSKKKKNTHSADPKGSADTLFFLLELFEKKNDSSRGNENTLKRIGGRSLTSLWRNDGKKRGYTLLYHSLWITQTDLNPQMVQ